MSTEQLEQKNSEEKPLVISDSDDQNKDLGYVQSLIDLLQKYGPDKQDKPSGSDLKKLPQQRFGNSIWMKSLLVYPYILLVAFLVSLIWDFPGMQATFFGYTLHFEGLLKIVTVKRPYRIRNKLAGHHNAFSPVKKTATIRPGLDTGSERSDCLSPCGSCFP